MNLDSNATSGAAPDAAAANFADEPVQTPSPGAQGNPDQADSDAEVEKLKAEKQEPELTEREKELQRKADDAEKAKRSMERRIDRLTRELRQQPAPQQAAPQDPNGQLTEADLVRLVETRATEVAAQNELNSRCNAVFQDAVKLDKNFESNFGALIQEVGPQFDAKGRPLPMMAAVLESDAPAKLLKHLTDNPDIAAEIMELPSAKQIRRVMQLETEIAEASKQKPKQPSQAPKPPTPVKGVASGDEPDQNDTARWIEWDRKQDQEKRKR